MRLSLLNLDAFKTATYGITVLNLETENHTISMLDLHVDVSLGVKHLAGGQVTRIVRKYRIYWELLGIRFLWCLIHGWLADRKLSKDLNERFGEKEN